MVIQVTAMVIDRFGHRQRMKAAGSSSNSHGSQKRREPDNSYSLTRNPSLGSTEISPISPFYGSLAWRSGG